MKQRRCGRIKYAPTGMPCASYNAVHQCALDDMHFGEHHCACEHQWDEWAKPGESVHRRGEER